MRIIDKNYDYYDPQQDHTDNINVFDRRGSYLLTKEDFCAKIKFVYRYEESKYRFVLFQCGAAFWLFLVTITQRDSLFGDPSRYRMELLSSWKNYNAPRKILNLQTITFIDYYNTRDYKIRDFDYDKLIAHANDFRDAVINNNYRDCVGRVVNQLSPKERADDKEIAYPLLRACGISELVDARDVYLALDEHFSLLKTEAEKTEAIGTTNNDKIVMHGFDTKTSFRGK